MNVVKVIIIGSFPQPTGTFRTAVKRDNQPGSSQGGMSVSYGQVSPLFGLHINIYNIIYANYNMVNRGLQRMLDQARAVLTMSQILSYAMRARLIYKCFDFS